MPTLQIAETDNQEKSLFLVSGSIPHITKDFVDSLIQNFKLIIINNPHSYTGDENLFQVYNTATQTISKLSEKIEYAVFFINSPDDKKILEQVIPKLEKDTPRTLILFSITEYETYSDILLRLKSVPNVMFGILGEVFGTEIPPSRSRMSKIIHRAITEKTITFVGNELVPVYPISKNDVLKGITYLLFSTEKSHRVFYFFYEHPQTIISTIHLLKRIEPELQISHDSSDKDLAYIISHYDLEKKIASQPLLKVTYIDDLLTGFENSVRNTSYSDTSKVTKKTIRKKKNKREKKPLRFKSSLIPLVIFTLLLFLICNVLLTLLGVFFAKKAVNTLAQGDFTSAKRQLNYATTSFDLSKPVILIGFEVLQLLPIPSLQNTYETFISGVAITELAAQQLTKIESASDGLAKDTLLDILATLSYLYFTAQSSPEYQNLPHLDYLTKNSTSNVLTTLSVLPSLMGYDTEKKYLLLFQNNGELRPTGGFIGSVGEVVIKNGKVEDFKIQDVYDIDGQITSHVEPPYIVRRYLQPHLFLRDSNFALDFQETATTAAALYKEGGGTTVDGVIALDYTVLQKIMEITGPLYLPSHNRTIDSKSGFEFIQSTIEETFVPGASQKKSILSEVFTQLLIKLEEPSIVFSVAKNLPELIEEKHILLAIKDTTTQDIFTQLNYAGSLRKNQPSTEDKYNEYLSINEANIGVNKANMSVTRSVSLLQKIQQNSISSSSTITLDNSKGKEDYKSYIRFITPGSTQFEELLINGKSVKTTPAVTSASAYEAPSFQLPTEVELTEELYQDKKVYGFVYTVPKGNIDYLTVQYSQDHAFSENGFAYDLTYQPQPGISPTPFTLSLEFPEGFIAKDKKSGSVAQKKYTSSYVIKNDSFIKIEFEKSN